MISTREQSVLILNNLIIAYSKRISPPLSPPPPPQPHPPPQTPSTCPHPSPSFSFSNPNPLNLSLTAPALPPTAELFRLVSCV